MAKTIARATGSDKTRDKETHRLGSKSASVEAATWRTFARAVVWKDGSGSISVTRDGTIIHYFKFDAETQED